ncbi:hypothetical protein [Alkalimarinus sediminis]|nr:hypothetical protein [Alkalimarinus sediminis]
MNGVLGDFPVNQLLMVLLPKGLGVERMGSGYVYFSCRSTIQH